MDETTTDPTVKRRARLARIAAAELPESFRVLLQNNAEHADEEVDEIGAGFGRMGKAIEAGFARMEKAIESGNTDRNRQTWVGGAAVFAIVLVLLFSVLQQHGVDTAAAVRDTKEIIAVVPAAVAPAVEAP